MRAVLNTAAIARYCSVTLTAGWCDRIRLQALCAGDGGERRSAHTSRLLGHPQLGQVCADLGEHGHDLAGRRQQVELVRAARAISQQRGGRIAAGFLVFGL